MTEEELDRRLARILADHDVTTCPTCGRTLDRGDLAWNEGATDSGTPYGFCEILCLACGDEIAVIGWWGGCDSFEEVLDRLDVSREEWRGR